MTRPNLAGIAPRRGGVMVPIGAYKCAIQRVEYEDAHDCFNLVFDIIEGPYKGTYESAPSDRDFQHRLTLWCNKPDSYDRVVGDLKVVDEWNPGFDAVAAFNREDDKAFFGKVVGIARRREVRRRSDTGEIKDYPNWFKLITPDELSSGKFAQPKDYIQKGCESAVNPAAQQASVGRVPDEVYEGDLPF